jgi:hypothetical protein
MKTKPVYAIIRFDEEFSEIESKITIKKIVFDIEYAKHEVERLNKLNGEKGCKYFWQLTRLESD